MKERLQLHPNAIGSALKQCQLQLARQFPIHLHFVFVAHRHPHPIPVFSEGHRPVMEFGPRVKHGGLRRWIGQRNLHHFSVFPPSPTIPPHSKHATLLDKDQVLAVGHSTIFWVLRAGTQGRYPGLRQARRPQAGAGQRHRQLPPRFEVVLLGIAPRLRRIEKCSQLGFTARQHPTFHGAVEQLRGVDLALALGPFHL